MTTFRPIAIVAAAILFVPVGAVVAAESQSPADCTLAGLVGIYAAGVADAEAGRYRKARSKWEPLAEAGFAPAQRRLAELLAGGNGVRKSITRAAFWAGLAARAGDSHARSVFASARGAFGSSGMEALTSKINGWTPARLQCRGDKAIASREAGEDRLRFTIDFHKQVGDDDRDAVPSKLAEVLKAAAVLEPGARLYLSLLDGIEFYPVKDNRYHRYVGFKRGIDGAVLRMPTSIFDDDKPEFAARSTLIVIKRRVYDALSDSELEDRLRRTYEGINVFGSVYPDVRNRTFFDMMQQSFDMAGRLPPKIRQYVDVIDEIYYNPASKHMVQEGTLDATSAYYNRSVSTEGYRVIFVRRDVLFASPLFMVRLLVHEGTHAYQDAKAWGLYQQAQRDHAALEKLKKEGKADSQEAGRLAAKINEAMDYAKRWYEGVQTDVGRVQDINFECEALIHEIAAVRHLGGDPEMLEDSGYLKLCPEAQEILIGWRDERRVQRARQ